MPVAPTRNVTGKQGQQFDIELFRTGDPKTITDIVNQHTSALAHLALHLTHNQQDADDLVQSTWLQAHVKRMTYRGGSMRCWLETIMRHLYVNRVRYTQRHLQLDTAELLEQITHRGTQMIEESIEELVDREVKAGARLLEAIKALSPTQRRVVLLRIFCDLSVHQVALLINRSDGTVKATFSQAVNRLRNKLQPPHDMFFSPSQWYLGEIQ